MNLHRMLEERASAGRPLRVALIGAGKFGSMYLAQAKHTPGIHLVAVADLAPDRAKASLARVGWPAERYAARTIAEAGRGGTTCVTDDTAAVIASPEVEIVIDATGSPAAGIRHALACCRHGKHVVMVNVEADALAGPLLARRAREAGIVYSLAYGDQPALICELVDWCRTAGFEVVAAGKGTKYLPAYHESTPATVWPHYGFTPEQVASGDFNAQMFNSFLDGTKSAIEMAAVANATGLAPASGGLAFPPCGVDDLPRVLRPRDEGGHLEHVGQVEVISSLERDGRPVFRDLRWGVYVTFRAGVRQGEDYVRRCFGEYGFPTDPSGRYSAMVQADARDRARARHLGRVGGIARRADRVGDRLARRRRRDREARARRRRDARRRRRLHGLRQAGAGRGLADAGRAAARARARREAQARSRGARERALGRRRVRSERRDRAVQARDGGGVRAVAAGRASARHPSHPKPVGLKADPQRPTPWVGLQPDALASDFVGLADPQCARFLWVRLQPDAFTPAGTSRAPPPRRRTTRRTCG